MRFSAVAASFTIIGIIVSFDAGQDIYSSLFKSIIISSTAFSFIRIIETLNRAVFILFVYISYSEKENKITGFSSYWLNYIGVTTRESASDAFKMSCKVLNLFSLIIPVIMNYNKISSCYTSKSDIVIYTYYFLVIVLFFYNNYFINKNLSPANYIDYISEKLDISAKQVKNKISTNESDNTSEEHF